MSYRRRNAYSSYYGSRGGSRGPADWLGLLALLCMLVCSVILLVRVLDADFHLGNGACYYEEQRIASTASVCTLAKSGVVRPGFPCRIASKSGEYPHRSLPFRQAMHGGTHFSLLANCETHLASNARVYTPVQSCWGNAPNP